MRYHPFYQLLMKSFQFQAISYIVKIGKVTFLPPVNAFLELKMS